MLQVYPVTKAAAAYPTAQVLSNACQLLAHALNSEFSGNCEDAHWDSDWKRFAGLLKAV